MSTTSSDPPKTMRAILVHKNGSPSVLTPTPSYPTPTLSSTNSLLVKNTFAGINYIDTYYRTGLYPAPPPGLPLILGQEAAGTVAAIYPDAPNELDFKVGDRVVWMKSGGYAEYTAVPAEKTIKIPDGISDEDAVGGFLMGMTALSLVREAYEVKSGDWALLHAAAGGVGLLMCQILKARGAHVIGTAGGKEKCDLAKENGAEITIDYKSAEGKSSWVQQVKDITSGRGVDVVYDSVGADTWEGSLDVVRRKGTVVFYGNASGPVPPFPISRLTPKNVKTLRPSLMNYTYTREEFEFYAQELFQCIKSGEMKIRIHGIYELDKVQQAHEDLEGRRTMGKLLLKI